VWNAIFGAWRGAMAVVTLRYLYLGLPDPQLSSPIVRSPAISPNAQLTDQAASHNVFEEFLQDLDDKASSYDPGEHTPSYTDSEHLSSETYMNDPFSRTPSPLPALHLGDENIAFDHWHRRYEIHNNALTELVSSISALSTHENASYLRYVLIPLMILALVSRPGSMERALFLEQMERFQTSMAQENTASPNPIGGSLPEIYIPWDQLDAYSLEMNQRQSEGIPFSFSKLYNTAPEWNWYYMLKHINLTSICE
jgi:hypothetical protein